MQETEKDENPVYVEDGFSSVYVNTEIKDNTEIAELMSCFLQTKIKNSKFTKLSNRVTQLKESKEGEKIGRAKEIIRLSRRFNIADREIQKELQNTLQVSQEVAQRYMESYTEIN